MRPRERVLKAFRQIDGLPDRVPVQFELCKPLLEHFSRELRIPVHYTHNLYEDVTYRISGNEIRTAMGCDVVVTGAGPARGYKVQEDENGRWLNEYGMLMKQGAVYVEPVEFPLAHAQTAADVAAHPFPDPHASGRYEDAEGLVLRYKDDYFVIGDIEVTILTLAQMLVGTEKLFLDMAMESEYLQPLFKACADLQIEVGIELIRRGVDAIWVGDDFGSQQGLLFSPKMFREQLKPHYERMLAVFKQTNANIVPILHCDGAVRELLGDIHEIGFDVFNPVQPDVPGHGPQELQDAHGHQFAFWGAIDQLSLLPQGSDEELERDIREKIRILGKDGGYMISPAHIIQSDVSPERVKTFIELCLRHGAYE